MKYLTKENISLAIATAGLVLSIINVIRQELFNRAKINLLYRSHYCGRTANFDLLIENWSKLDISISRMFLVADNNEYEFRYMPKTVWKIGNDAKGCVKEIESISLPQTILGLGAIGGYFCVDVGPEIISFLSKSGVSLTMKIVTNRGAFSFSFIADKYHLENIY